MKVLALRERVPQVWQHVVMLLVGGAAVYCNSFGGPFLFDDSVMIVNSPSIHQFDLSWSDSRLVTNFTFALNYYLHGEHTAGYHIVNVLLHLGNALLVYALVILLFKSPRLGVIELSAKSKDVAFLAALIFVVHPIQSQAVAYIAQRYTSMAAFFYLGAICLYLLFRLGASGQARRYSYYAAFIVAAALACKSKENAATLPVAVLLVEVLLFDGGMKKRLLYFTPFILALVAVGLYFLTSGVSLEQVSAKTRVDTMMSRHDYLMTQLRVVVTYLRLLVFPINQNLDYDYPTYSSVWQWEVLLSLLLHVMMFGAAGYCLVRAKAKPLLALIALGILWFYVTLAVESSIIPIVDVIFEHRVYLPSVGAVVLASVAFYSIPGLSRDKATRILAIATLIVPLATATLYRNQVWASGFSLWSDVVSKSPNKARPLNNLGVMYYDRGELELALSYYLAAIAKDPQYMKAYFNAGEAYQDLKNFEQALIYYRLFVSAWPDYPMTYKKLAEVYRALGREHDAAIHEQMYDRLKRGTLSRRYR